MTHTTKICVVACLVALSTVSRGGQYVRQVPEYTTDQWAECWADADAPFMSHIVWDKEGILPDGTFWQIKNEGVTITRGDDIYVGGWFYSNESISCNRYLGTWTWSVYRSGDTTNMTAWIHPGLLSQGIPNMPTPLIPDLTVDAADASTLFRFWETPVGDITGDGWTDAADAGRLFELWTGDSYPVSVPEPTGIPALLLLIALGKCNRVYANA